MSKSQNIYKKVSKSEPEIMQKRLGCDEKRRP